MTRPGLLGDLPLGPTQFFQCLGPHVLTYMCANVLSAGKVKKPGFPDKESSHLTVI